METCTNETEMMQAESCCDIAIQNLQHHNTIVTPDGADNLLCEITNIIHEKGYAAAKQYALSIA